MMLGVCPDGIERNRRTKVNIVPSNKMLKHLAVALASHVGLYLVSGWGEKSDWIVKGHTSQEEIFILKEWVIE